ncbi:MAG: ATP-binding protein [Fusobacterium necrophorum]|nr:ATP-binding protein [Fusobacterium necrophorum]
MKKCKYCGMEYIKNPNLNFFPESIRSNLELIPNCNCLFKIEEKKQNEEWKNNLTKSRMKKYENASIVSQNIKEMKFENTTINMNKTDKMDRHLRISLKFVDEFLKNKNMNGGIYFYGSVGTGKTFTTSCIANKLIENQCTVLILNLGLYFLKLRTEWSEAEIKMLELVEKCDLLIIDDLGTEKVSDFVLEKTFNLINKRYTSQKALLVTSNLTLSEIAKVYNERIADRINEMCVQVEVYGKSRRVPNTEWLTA